MTDPFSGNYYGEVYRNYRAQNPSAKLSFYRDLVDHHFPAGMPRTIHDIGCAFGLFLNSLESDWQRLGSDISTAAIAYASQHNPECRFIEAAVDTEMDDERFSVVTAWDVIEHSDNLERVAAAIDRQLSEGGIFLFVVPVYDGPLGPLVQLLDKDPTHIQKHSRRFWLEWAAEHFEVVAWHGIVRYLLPFHHYLHWPTQRLRGLAPAIAVVCRKELME